MQHFPFLISPLAWIHADEDSAPGTGIVISFATIVFGFLLVVPNVFFESFHLILKPNETNGIAESAMIFNLDYAHLALKFDKLVFLSRELSLTIFCLRFHIDAPSREIPSQSLPRC